jgi:glutamyl-tRNA synthetase
LWLAVRGNLQKLGDVAGWQRVVSGPILPVIENAAFAKAAAALLPPEPWTSETWSAWTNAVKTSTGAKGRALFHPLRMALTGLENGPELKALLPLIGRARVLARLNGEHA